MDSYVRAFVKTHVRIDSGQRVWCKGEELQTVMSGSERKVLLPEGLSRVLYTFEDLKRAGAQCDVVTLKSLAKMGGEGRWRERIEERRASGLPSNVYVANARSVQYALDKGKPAPPLKYVGRLADRITGVYCTVDEVVTAMDRDQWRTEFSRGSRKARSNK